MYLYFDRKGVLKEIVNDKALRQGSQDYNNIYIYVDELVMEEVNSVWFKFVCDNGNVFLPECQLEETDGLLVVESEIPFNEKRDLKYFEYYKVYPFYKVPTTFEVGETIYNALDFAGTSTLSLRINITNSNTMKLGLIVFNVEASNEGTNEIQSQEFINLAQWNYLLQQFNRLRSMYTVDVPNTISLGELFDLIGEEITVVNVKNKGSYLTKLIVASTNSDGSPKKLSFEMERYAGGITNGQDRYTGQDVLPEVILSAILDNNSIYFRPYLVTNVPFDMATNTLKDIYDRISNKAAIIRLNGSNACNGFYLIKMEKIEDVYDVEAEKIGMGNSPVDDGKGSYRFIASNLTTSDMNMLIEDFFDDGSDYFQPYALAKTLDEYYYTKSQINTLLEMIRQNNVVVVDITDYPTLQDFLDDESSAEEGTIYLYPIDTSEEPDFESGYYRYIYEANGWVYLGTTQINLSNYVTKDTTQEITGEKTFKSVAKFKSPDGNYTISLDMDNNGSLYIYSGTKSSAELGIGGGRIVTPICMLKNTARNDYWQFVARDGGDITIRYSDGTNTPNNRYHISNDGIFPTSDKQYDLGREVSVGNRQGWRDVYISRYLKMENSQVKDFIKLTQAQYDTLVANDEVDLDTIYFIKE